MGGVLPPPPLLPLGYVPGFKHHAKAKEQHKYRLYFTEVEDSLLMTFYKIRNNMTISIYTPNKIQPLSHLHQNV